MLCVEFFPFAINGCELVHLVDLPLQSLTFLLQISLGQACLLQGFLILSPLGPERCGFCCVHPCKCVQQAAYRVWSCKALPSMLPVDV